MDSVRVKVKRIHARAKLPIYAHRGPSGDLAADLVAVQGKHLAPGEVALMRTGLVAEFPQGFGAIIEDRSSLAIKGVCTLGGVIDPGYRGEIKIVVANVGRKPVILRRGDRIAQMRIVRRLEASFLGVNAVSHSQRGAKGFGSTGLEWP